MPVFAVACRRSSRHAGARSRCKSAASGPLRRTLRMTYPDAAQQPPNYPPAPGYGAPPAAAAVEPAARPDAAHARVDLPRARRGAVRSRRRRGGHEVTEQGHRLPAGTRADGQLDGHLRPHREVRRLLRGGQRRQRHPPGARRSASRSRPRTATSPGSPRATAAVRQQDQDLHLRLQGPQGRRALRIEHHPGRPVQGRDPADIGHRAGREDRLRQGHLRRRHRRRDPDRHRRDRAGRRDRAAHRRLREAFPAQEGAACLGVRRRRAAARLPAGPAARLPAQGPPPGYPQQAAQGPPPGYPQQGPPRAPPGYAQQGPPPGYPQQNNPQQGPPPGYPQQSATRSRARRPAESRCQCGDTALSVPRHRFCSWRIT